MRIHLVGESARHAHELVPSLAESWPVTTLPREAAWDPAHDASIDPDDVVVSLRWSRPSGAAPPFRLLHVPGAGLDGVEAAGLDPATLVANVFEHEIPIAEFVLARLLEWEIRAGAMQAGFSPDRWSDTYRNRVPHGEVHGKTLVLLGYGRIARAIAARAHAFGIHVVALDPHVAPEDLDLPVTLRPPDDLLDVVATCDYLVLACPLTEATRGWVDASVLAAAAPHLVLVNASRAEVADEEALYRALADREIAGAVLDVWYRYPSADDDQVPPAHLPFWDLENAWCTPHSSAWTRQLAGRRYAVVADNINRLATGSPLRNLVTPSPTTP